MVFTHGIAKQQSSSISDSPNEVPFITGKPNGWSITSSGVVLKSRESRDWLHRNVARSGYVIHGHEIVFVSFDDALAFNIWLTGFLKGNASRSP